VGKAKTASSQEIPRLSIYTKPRLAPSDNADKSATRLLELPQGQVSFALP
jgi:hypothetical protein